MGAATDRLWAAAEEYIVFLGSARHASSVVHIAARSSKATFGELGSMMCCEHAPELRLAILCRVVALPAAGRL